MLNEHHGLQNSCVVALYGVPGVGKTTISQSLVSKFRGAEIQTTDSLFYLNRLIEPNHRFRDLYSQTAWKIFGKRNKETIWNGFSGYRREIEPVVLCLMERAFKEEFRLILEGIHFDPRWRYTDSQQVVPVFLFIDDA